MFASLDLSNGWLIASRGEVIGFTDEAIRSLMEQRADAETGNRFRDAMVNAAQVLFHCECVGRC